MKIKEVEELLSVSRANIRFYEKEGLLTPNRETNNYRDYSEENIKELKKIILFRKLGFTIEEIKKLQKGEINLKDASADNIARLESEIESLKGALNLTQKLADEQTDFDAVAKESRTRNAAKSPFWSESLFHRSKYIKYSFAPKNRFILKNHLFSVLY